VDPVAVVVTFGTIFLVELPDKTFLATLVLATRYRPLFVWIGVSLAFAVQTVVAVLLGHAASFLPADRQAVRNARVEVRTENDAFVILASNVAPVALHRNRFDRQWRVVLRVIGELNDGEERSAEPGSQRRIGYFRAVARALTRTRDMVAANQIGSPADVGAAVLKFLSRPSQGSN